MTRSSPKRIIGFWLGLLVLAALAVVASLQQQTIAQLRRENLRLQNKAVELDRLRAEAGQVRDLSNQQAEIEQLREANRDLLRLRNEVRQLRQQQQEVETLREANARLLQSIQGTSLSASQQVTVTSVRKEGALLGVVAQSASDLQRRYNGAVVMSIDPNSPVSRSDLKPGDIIVRIDGRVIENVGQLQAEMLTHKPGDTVVLDVMRNDTPLRITVATRDWPQ